MVEEQEVRQRKLQTIPPLHEEKQVLVQFFENTTIHGLKYIFEKGTTLLERLAWILIFSSGIFFSGYFCFQMWQKWDQSPILTSVETQLYPLKNVLFPAITICNVNKVSRKRLTAMLNTPKFANVSYSQLQTTLRYMTKLDRAITNEKHLHILDEFYTSRNITASDLLLALEETSPSCSDMIIDCNWLGLPTNCMTYFSFLPTDDGMCCIFNGPVNVGLASKTGHKEPLRVNGNGYRMGLSLVLDAEVDDYSVTNGKFDGFKVLVHGSGEFADISDRGFVIGPGTETFVGVKGISSFNTEEVGNQVSLQKRNCLTEGEKKLKNFEDYSQSSCFVECATQLMQQRCSCRPYFFQGKKEKNLCQNLTSYTCIAQVYDQIRFGDEICNCLPPCSDTWYEPEISYAPFPGTGFNLTRTFRRITQLRNLTSKADSTVYMKSNVAVLHVYYKQKTGMRYRTDIRFGSEDFISAIGGLLGLGLGVSFISVVELLYYIFCRKWFLRYRKYLKEKRLEAKSTRRAALEGTRNASFCAAP